MSDSHLLNYRIVGDGYPVLFLHGFLESSTMWNELLPSFQSHFKCILIDLPGHGLSTDGLNPIRSIHEIAKAVNATLQHLSIDRYHVVGHSLGGYVSLALIETYREFNDKLILLNSHPWPDSESKKEERSRVIKVVEKNKELFIRTAIPNLFVAAEKHSSFVNELIKEAERMDSAATIDALIAMRDRPCREQVLKQLEQRAFILQGKYDHLIPYKKMHQFALNNNNRFKLLNSAGHMSHVEARENVIEEITNYLT